MVILWGEILHADIVGGNSANCEKAMLQGDTLKQEMLCCCEMVMLQREMLQVDVTGVGRCCSVVRWQHCGGMLSSRRRCVAVRS